MRSNQCSSLRTKHRTVIISVANARSSYLRSILQCSTMANMEHLQVMSPEGLASPNDDDHDDDHHLDHDHHRDHDHGHDRDHDHGRDRDHDFDHDHRRDHYHDHDHGSMIIDQ